MQLRSALQALVPPSVEHDPAGRLSGRLVAGILDLLIAGVIAFSAIILVSPGKAPPLYRWTLPAGLLLLYALRRLARSGHVRSAAVVLSVGGWLMVAQDLRMLGTNTVAIGGFILLIVIGALTLGPVAALSLAGATIALLAAVMLHGAAPDAASIVPSNEMRFLHYTVQLGLAALLVAWWALEMRRLLRQLRTSEARHSQLLEESPDAIVSVDRTGMVQFCNGAFEAMLGYPRSEIVGRRWAEMRPMAGDLDLLGERFAAILAGQGTPMSELDLVHRDGRTVSVEAKTVARREEGQVVGLVSILRDVSARKQADLERSSLHSQLVRAQRMESISRFAGGIAHDFNNILTVVLSSAEVMPRANPADDRAVTDIEDAAMRGAMLTRQLLTFSRRQPSEARVTDINRAIETLRPLLERLLCEDIAVKLDLAASPLNVMIDPGQLDQVIMNLAVNARDAISGGGTLRLSTALTRNAPWSGPTIEIAVSDTGAGMDAATLTRAFEPFYTTKGERGTGLGLSVVQGIVEQAGGTIRCESEPGQGTTFWIALPAVSGPALASTRPEAPGAGVRSA